jgi:hypothetical protein
MRFREHGHDKPIVQLDDRAALVAHLKMEFAAWPSLDDLELAKLKTEPYGRSIFWDGQVWLLTLPGYGVIGYTDEPL